MSTIAANQFRSVYEMLGIDPENRGCIMIDVEPITVSDIIPADDLWFDESMEARGGANTPTAELEPHVTLLYGLMHSGPEMKKAVDGMLEGWQMPEAVEIEEVSFFYGNPDEPNVAIVAKVKVSPDLLEGNQRLKQLPHIDTYPEYMPHITLAYVKDNVDYEAYISELNERLAGVSVPTTGLNYGH